MTNSSSDPAGGQPRDAANWAGHVDTLKVAEVPAGAVNINVEGRRVVGPLQGFGALWQKTYQVRLRREGLTPAEIIRAWKQHFPEFQPPQNRFYPSVAGVAPGEVVLINASLQGLPVGTGVMVLYADEESFTLMTPQGHPESGWVTFSAFPDEEDAGTIVAQVQSMARANDPMYELGFRFGASRMQEQIWTHVLTSLAARFECEQDVSLSKTCVDPKLQWSQAKNIWHNAAMRSMLYTLSAPARWVREMFTPGA
jgi:Domain of unknown function (DUF1990)